jgi:hypothetical protein
MRADRAAAAERLGALLRREPGLTVVTGGQTGVDTFAAIAALRARLALWLVFPSGWMQEDGPLTTARRRRLAGARFHELPSAEFADRTWACVGASDAVVLIDPAGCEGCQETRRAAAALSRPLLEPGPLMAGPDIAAWPGAAHARVILVAGCRASLLASQRKTGDARARVAVVAEAAALRHEELTRCR